MLQLPEEDYKRLRDMADRERRSLKNFVERIVYEYMEKGDAPAAN